MEFDAPGCKVLEWEMGDLTLVAMTLVATGCLTLVALVALVADPGCPGCQSFRESL